MGERCLVLLRELKEENFDNNNLLDSSNLTPKQTADEVLRNARFII